MKRSRSSSPSASSISDQDQEQLGHDRGRGRSRNRDRDRGRSSSRDGDGATRARSPPPSRLGSGDNSIRPRHMHNEGYDVGVFWDYENVRIPRWCRTADAANAIRSAVIGFGRISERRLYYDSKKVSEQYTDRVNLDLSGFTLVDCPSRGRKETLDKRLIVDILGFAWERAARHIPTCVVLITSDGDYSYTVAKLRDIGVCTVIVHGERTTTADVLLDACDHAMSWIFDVLRRPTLEEGEDDSEGVGGHDFSQRPDTNTSSADQKRQLGSPQQQLASMNSILEGDMSMLPLSREASLSEAREGRHLVFLNCVSAIQMQQLSKQLSQSSDDLGYGTGGEMTEATRKPVQFRWEDCWALDTQVVQLFNSKRGMHGNDPNSFYKQLRKSAVAGQFISVGRQDMVTGDIIDVTAGGVSSIQLQNLRPQQFLRLTPEGRAQMSGEHITGSGSGTDSGSGGFDISTIREG